MHLVVGLGNPGPKYALHRHNVGFMVVDLLARRWGAPALRTGLGGQLARARQGAVDAVLLEPLTYMNRSGESVQRAMAFYRIPLERTVVVHDEMDLPFGQCRIKVGGGAAGHNGLSSIIQHGGGTEFRRIRVGIGRPPGPRGASWVLSDFSAEERLGLPEVLERAAGMVESVLTEGAERAMNRWHAS